MKIHNTQQNYKCSLCGDWDETINHIISECSKLAQKEYKTRYDWIRKMIQWKLYKRLKFYHCTKLYLHKPEYILENRVHKILYDFDMQTDCQIPTRRPYLVLINKKIIISYFHFAVSADCRVKINENEDWEISTCQRNKESVEYEDDGDANCNWSTGNSPLKAWKKRLEELKIRDRQKTILRTALLWLARILRRVLRTWGELLSLTPSETPLANAGVKNLL